LIVRQAGQRTQRNQYRAAIAGPIVGENSMGILLDSRRRLDPRRIGRAPGGGLGVDLGLSVSFHPAAVESHAGSSPNRAE